MTSFGVMSPYAPFCGALCQQRVSGANQPRGGGASGHSSLQRCLFLLQICETKGLSV